jgi:hypothetical protein
MNLDNPITSKQEKETGKLVKFTYTGRETEFMTKLFKHTKLKVAFLTSTSAGKQLRNTIHLIIVSI